MSVTVDVSSIGSAERFKPVIPQEGLRPRKGLLPATENLAPSYENDPSEWLEWGADITLDPDRNGRAAGKVVTPGVGGTAGVSAHPLVPASTAYQVVLYVDAEAGVELLFEVDAYSSVDSSVFISAPVFDGFVAEGGRQKLTRSFISPPGTQSLDVGVYSYPDDSPVTYWLDSLRLTTPTLGGASVSLEMALASILSSEAWGQPSVSELQVFLGSIASGEDWTAAPALAPHTGLYPGAGLHPSRSGLSWAFAYDGQGIPSGEAMGEPLGVSILAARVFVYLTLASALREVVEVKA